MILKRLSVFICPLLILAGLESLLLFDNWKILFIISVFLIVILFLFLKLLIKEKILSQDFFYLSVLPFLLLFTLVIFLLILGA
ncbi:hypothetical protein ACFL2U_03835, partial [Patescibacteria group bacterium]